MFKHVLCRKVIGVCAAALLTTNLVGCSGSDEPKVDKVEPQTEQINEWFEGRWQEELAKSPMTQTYFGLQDGLDKLDDVSQAARDEEYALEQQSVADMRDQFSLANLDRQGKISYRLFEYNGNVSKSRHEFAGHGYVFDQMFGPHGEFPTFMVNFHAVKSAQDARAYIARLNAIERFLGQHQSRAEAQANAGILLPKFAYAKLIEVSRNVITGAPFTEGDASPLYADITSKISDLKSVSQVDRDVLLEQAELALLTSVAPAYNNLIAMFEAHAALTNDDDGVWKLPNGAAYYQSQLNYSTTTELTADEIHNIGLAEVARIQEEMRKIMAQVEFDGSLQDFYNFLRTDPQFVLSNNDAGREQYMAEATAVIATMKAKLDDLFITKPKADMVVKRVEEFREATAAFAFYEQPSLDGKRPGAYFINLEDVRDQPRYLMQALAYHEGIPGHHMQIAIAMELEGIPEFRKQGGHTAYIEGWGLYAESVPAELGMYTDPYSDFGRLSMEIFRAARLVVDTGIHSKKWTREQAVQYMLENIANPEGDIRAEIDRYIVWPGQATAYKIGMLKIGDLKKHAQSELGENFDIREFHDVVLANGSVPLSLLEELVNEWIENKKLQQ